MKNKKLYRATKVEESYAVHYIKTYHALGTSRVDACAKLNRAFKFKGDEILHLEDIDLLRSEVSSVIQLVNIKKR